MSLPFLLVGATNQIRRRKALQISAESSAPFDQIVLDAEKEAGINEIRRLGEMLSRRPWQGNCLTAVILEAQNLTLEAQNAFLKNLEEAAEHVKIILTAPSKESLLPTIASRCLKIELPSEDEKIKDWDFFKGFLSLNPYQRYRTLAKLDLETWQLFWREVLLSLFCLRKLPFSLQGEPRKISRYLKLINKAIFLQNERKAAPKVLKALLTLEAPKLELR